MSCLGSPLECVMFPGPKAASVKEKMLFVEPARYRTPSSEDEGPGATVLSLAGLALTAPELLLLPIGPLLLSADASLCTTTSWLPSGLSGRLGKAWVGRRLTLRRAPGWPRSPFPAAPPPPAAPALCAAHASAAAARCASTPVSAGCPSPHSRASSAPASPGPTQPRLFTNMSD